MAKLPENNTPSPPLKPNAEQKLGKNMMIIGWMILLGLLTLFFGNWEKDQYNPNRDINSTRTSSSTTVTLERNAYHHYVTSGKVNGQDVMFMLDTGATSVAIPPALAQQLNLTRGRAYTVKTANGNSTAYTTQIDTLELGAISLHNVRAAIASGMQGHEILLGMSALKQLEFNQRGNILTLIQHHP